MCFLLMCTTGLVCVGKGRQHHMSKLYDTADVICTVQGARGVCALRALVIDAMQGSPMRDNIRKIHYVHHLAAHWEQ